MDQLRKLTCKYQEIIILEKNHFLAFKRCFVYIAQKCLKLPAITENKELVDLFVRNINIIFQNILNLRLSLIEKVKINEFGRSRIKDSYNLKHVIQKAVELVSGKTIVQTLKQTIYSNVLKNKSGSGFKNTSHVL